MKKTTLTILAAAMAASLLAGSSMVFAESSTEAGGDAAFVFKHGFDLDYPPYSYIDDEGKTNGFDVELAQAVCDYYVWQYEAVPFNWDAKDAELNAGSCEIGRAHV